MKKLIAYFAILVSLLLWSGSRAGSQDTVYIPLVAKDNTSTPTATNTPIPATFTPLPTSTLPAPTATNTPLPTATQPQIANVQIVTINPTGSEYVEIRNDGNGPAQLLNWTLADLANHAFTFPSFVMQPGQTCRIYTDANHPEWCGFNYNSGSPIWNNDGDCATLKNSNGQIVDTYCY